MEKTILTWTYLCNRAKYLAEHNHAEYINLTSSSGTDRMISGHHVSMIWGGKKFIVRKTTDQASPVLLEVTGIVTDDGQYYTKMHAPLTPTRYRKRFWDKHMPVSFPAGLPKRGAGRSVAVFHSTKGSTFTGFVELPIYRNHPADFTVKCDMRGTILIEDESGKLVHINGERSNRQIGDPLTESNDAVRVFEIYRHDNSTWKNFPGFRPTDLQETAEIYEGSCKTRDEWLKSILVGADGGLMDRNICLPLAARMWNSAYLFCQENKELRPTFHAYPLEKCTARVEDRVGRLPMVLHWKDPQTIVVNGENETAPSLSTDVVLYYAPMIEVQFEGAEDGNKYHHPTISHNTRIPRRSITMTLPPHGNPLLYGKEHHAHPYTRTYVAKSAMRGEYYWGTENDKPQSVAAYDSHAGVASLLERAYHAIPIWNPDIHNIGMPLTHHQRRYHVPAVWSFDTKGCYAKWEDHPDAVHVRTDFDYNPHGDDGPWLSATSGSVGFPCTPESAVAVMSESLLLDSLPLS
jgi:hypothetical protein